MADLEIIKEKWQTAAKIQGYSNIITLSDGEQISGYYYLCSVGAVTASHNALSGFAPTDGFPTDENGNSVNDRDYFRDKDAQEITRNIAASYDSRAIQNPVIVSGDGVTLSGNGRTMAGEIAAANNTDGAYIEYLINYGGQFGFSADMVRRFSHPRIVFVVNDDLPYNASTFAKFNHQDMKSQSKTEQAVKFGKLVSDEVFGRILATINAFETLGEFYANTEAATKCISELRKCGVFSSMQFAEMFDGDTISSFGKELLENVLIGKAFANNPDCARMITAYKSLRKSVVFGLSEVVNNLCLSDAYSLNFELSEAVNLAYIARQHGYNAGDRVSEYSRQMDAFSNETVCNYKDTCILVLADALNDNQVTLLKRILAVYNHQAKDASDGQTDMFSSGGVKTKEEILDDVKAIFAKGTTQEKKQAENEATEARLSENIFLSQEQTTKVTKGGFVEFPCKSGDNIICQVDNIKRGIAYLIGKGGIKLWCSVSSLKPTADHKLSLPDWLRTGEVLTDGKSLSQRINEITDNYVIFDWINGGLFDVNIATILQNFAPSKTGVVGLL